MIAIDIQIHGYRKGHQLLASSISLSKDDQATVDRLSDVAGPLRPKEHFEPYLTAYPLPSGIYYVIARTWQDHSVPRAGCVRTKSLLINAKVWSNRPPLGTILKLLDSSRLPSETEAIHIEQEELLQESLPPVSNFNASELLEALFLEEPKPIVIFDVPKSELVALHLLIALWPNIRQRFALSTFALSPRKIMGRDLDLVFSPSNAKARFSDWPGRRVDGRSPQAERHRWTKVIVRRVFEEPTPKLLSNSTIKLLGNSEAESVSVLRIALLWDELFGKLEQTPTAVLGLLDIANSGMVNNSEAMKSLEPQLFKAIRGAAVSLPGKDAWEFAGALVRKMKDRDMPTGIMAVNNLAAYLSEQAPEGVINLLQQPDTEGVISSLIPGIALGLGNGPWPMVKQVLLSAPMSVFAHLILQGKELVSQIANDDELIKVTGLILPKLDQGTSSKVGTILLPLLIEDRHLPAALPIICKLDSQEVAEELYRLRDVNDYLAQKLSAALICRAREIGGISDTRDILISSNNSARAEALLALTIDPTETDVLWLLDEKRLSETASTTQLVNVLRRADERQFTTLLSNSRINEYVVARLSNMAVDILERAALQDTLPIDAYVNVIQAVIPEVSNDRKLEIAKFALGRCLHNRFKDETIILPMLLGILGEKLDGRWIAHKGLERNIGIDIASRNMIALEKSPSTARRRIIEAVDEIAHMLQERRVIYLDEDANDACARLMFDAEDISYVALVDAAATLIPSLLHTHRQPISLMIAALFPIIYKELANLKNVPKRLNIFFFFDWDRCKAARIELVEAFMSSSWRPGDLALTACRCNDVSKILTQVAQSYSGEKYLAQIENDLDRLDESSKIYVQRVITECLYE
ncbi:hypothetical protein RBG07_12070 [Klebsiella aerogenes]|uniref:GAP1-N1 domain-containing protein n=1 Tax=Klebsiella aerogenes TaxID=548 RepID=UPI0028E07568|nr:hypothetical protein [Klebsiella aerogenes]MDT8883253.1 hypothetical protein [Klebsiella aerogenes]